MIPFSEDVPVVEMMGTKRNPLAATMLAAAAVPLETKLPDLGPLLAS
jgi:hypothetical protein